MYGGAVGAGVGLAQVLLRRGPDVDLPRSTIFEARFDKPLEIPADSVRRATEMARAGAPPINRDLRIPDEPLPDFRDPERPKLSRRTAAGETPVETARIDPPADTPAPSPAPPPPPRYEPAAADPGAFKMSVSVKLVQVDALVRDRTGRPMDNLKRDDFRLFENGVEQPIQSFTRDELPLAVALVVDRSGSVAPFMNEIRHAAYRALMQLKPGDEVCLFSFAGDVERLEDLTPDRQRVADRIATIRAGGGTNIVDAVYNSVNYLGLVAPERRRAIILISDNQATTHPRASEADAIRLAMETETVVYSVKTGGEALPLTLRLPNLIGGGASVRKIAEETGGEIIDVAAAGSLDAALRTAVARLKLRYTLGYYPGSPSPGTFRRIEVRLADHFGTPVVDYRVNARRGYYYPSATPASANKESSK
jgi:Ca-activated chloride channel family protein